jgi:DNA-binding transcriptional regulator YiaG
MPDGNYMTPTSRAVQQVAEARQFIASGEARSIREALGLSLFDVAPSIPADPSAIGRWERGERTPRGAVAVKYARLLRRLRSQVAA